MNLSFFIAKRVVAAGQAAFARLIIRIATAAVAVSVAVMIIAVCLIKGFKSEISAKMFGFWGHIHITSIAVNTTFEPTPIELKSSFLDSLKAVKPVQFVNRKTGELLSTKGGILHAQSYATKAGIIKTKDNFEGIVLKGVGRDYNWDFIKHNLDSGRIITPSNDSELSRDILISQSTANRLKLKLNSKFIIHFVKDNQQQQRVFQVSGIYKTGLEEYDKQFALVDIRQVQDLLGWKPNQVAGFEVFTENLSDLGNMNDYIAQELISNELYTMTIKQEQPAIFQWLDLQDVNEAIILGLMLVVGILNMVTALLILILERTNMIGTLKALGGNDGDIQRIFLYYGAMIVGIGLLIGNFIGLGLCFLQDKYKFIKLSESDYYLSVAPVHFDFPLITMVNIGTFMITLLFLVLPTFLVTKISPLKAIRFK
jgi:lipoprotein-releasing system permease protein